MAVWTSPEFVLNQSDIGGMRWLGLRYGSIGSRVFAVSYMLFFFASATLATISAIGQIVTREFNFALFVGLYLGFMLAVAQWKAWRRRRVDGPAERVAQWITLSGQGIFQRSKDGTCDFVPWGHVTYVTANRRGLYLVYANSSCYIVPARCFATESELATVRETVDGYCSDHASVDLADVDVETPSRPPDATFTLTDQVIRSIVRARHSKSGMRGTIALLSLAIFSYVCSYFDAGAPWSVLTDYSLSVFLLVCSASYVAQIFSARSFIGWTKDRQWRLWLEADKLVFASTDELSEVPWRIVDKVEAVNDCICITQVGSLMRVIPMSAWGRWEDAQDFLARIESQRSAGVDPEKSAVPDDVWPPPPKRR